MTGIYVAIATGIHAVLVVTAGSARAWLAEPKRTLIVRRGLSLALVGVAGWVVINS